MQNLKTRHNFIFTLVVLFCCISFYGFGQGVNRTKNIAFTRIITIDTLHVDPSSIHLYAKGKAIPINYYSVNWQLAQVKLNIDSIKNYLMYAPDSLKLFYQAFPIQFTKKYYHKQFDLTTKSNKYQNFFTYNYEQESDKNEYNFDALNKMGSISRGITFGNNQDLTVNSNLNLQLSGKLSNDIEILAAITDDNIPIQPNGNTQQLQQFDKVFIQLNKDGTKLTAGDYQLKKPSGYFMNYYKRIQGINVSTAQTINEKNNMKIYSEASAAVSKGKFSRNVIQGVENNQGPYKVRGAENEIFIIVLSGTEKVYIDGQLLTRGQENDYVIDYNTAEITFTAKKLITKDRRIVVEFQYTDKNYARSLVQWSNTFDIKNTKVFFNVYSEQDNKNRPLQQKLNDNDKLVLYNAGNDMQKAIALNVDSVGYKSGDVLYSKKDTIIGNLLYSSIYEFSTNPAKAVYQVGFSNVGVNNGNYIQDLSGYNGKVYKWVAPVNGQHQGSYEPIVQLIAPKRRSMYNAGVMHSFSKTLSLNAEVAASDYDQNTFSPYNSNSNIDFASKWRLSKTFFVSKKDTLLLLKSSLLYEQLNKNFAAIERFRSVEFERDWNTKPGAQLLANQVLPGAEVSLEQHDKGNITYTITSFNEGAYYTALQNKLNTNFKFKKTFGFISASNTSTKDTVNKTAFDRVKGSVSRQVKKVVVNFKGEAENNLFKVQQNDSLIASSYRFNEWYVTLSNADSTNNKYAAYYTQRTDWKPIYNDLYRSSFAQGGGVTVELTKNYNHQLKLNSSYRQLTIIDDKLTSQTPDNTLLNRIEQNFRVLKGLVATNSFYEIGSGLEQKKEYSFIQVQAGQGNYTWKDYNENGVQELNEFEIAAFQDQAKYIKVYTLTNNYVKTYTNAFNTSININPAAYVKQRTTFLKILAKLSNQTTYKTDNKITRSESILYINPFFNTINDSNLIATNSSFRNTFYINKSSGKFGLDVNVQKIKSKNLLINGFDAKENSSQSIKTRYNLDKGLTITCEATQGQKLSYSEYLINRNYTIIYKEVEPKITIQPNNIIRTSFNYKYSEKKNAYQNEGSSCFINKLGVEFKYSAISKTNLTAQISLINIKYNGETNTAWAFDMLEALNPGKNITWNVQLQQNLSSNLQLNLNYDARKSEGNKIIHIGGIQARAFF